MFYKHVQNTALMDNIELINRNRMKLNGAHDKQISINVQQGKYRSIVMCASNSVN